MSNSPLTIYKQVKEFTGLTGADMDLFMTNDFYNQSEFLAAEMCEYLPKGEAWAYTKVLTSFDLLLTWT